MKIKVVMIPVDRAPYVTNVEYSLENFQKIVGGYIECVGIGEYQKLVVNEEGLLLNLPRNFSSPVDDIVGDCFIAGTDMDGDFCSLSDEYARSWLKWCKAKWHQSWEERHGI